MKYISHRTGSLELRRTQNLVSKEDYLEVVRWYKVQGEEPHCCTIAIFKKTKEGHDLESVGDRILLDKEEWKDFGILIKIGFEFLSSDDKSTHNNSCENQEDLE